MAQTKPIISQQKRRTCPFSKPCAISNITDIQQFTGHISSITPIRGIIVPTAISHSLPHFTLSAQ